MAIGASASHRKPSWRRDEQQGKPKRREARLEYNLPASLLKKTKFIQGASIAVFATNIFSWDEWPQFDPEGGMMTGANVFNGIETGAFPMTRTQGVNVRLSF